MEEIESFSNSYRYTYESIIKRNKRIVKHHLTSGSKGPPSQLFSPKNQASYFSTQSNMKEEFRGSDMQNMFKPLRKSIVAGLPMKNNPKLQRSEKLMQDIEAFQIRHQSCDRGRAEPQHITERGGDIFC